MLVKAIKAEISKISDIDAIVNVLYGRSNGDKVSVINEEIKRAAGLGLIRKMRNNPGCMVGETYLTDGYCLPVKHVIHTIVPLWIDGDHNESRILYDCYINIFREAMENNIHSIAIPSLSTGIGFPINIEVKMAVFAIMRYFEKYPDFLDSLLFVLSDDISLYTYKKQVDFMYFIHDTCRFNAHMTEQENADDQNLNLVREDGKPWSLDTMIERLNNSDTCKGWSE